MTYNDLKLLINEAYSKFCADYVKRKTIGADEKYPLRQDFFVKCMWKVLLSQEGDETKDLLTKEEIQAIIVMFNKYSNSYVEIEYT